MDSEKRMDRLEEDLATIVKLVKMSMQIALQNQQAINALIARQRRSEEKADRPIASRSGKASARR